MTLKEFLNTNDRFAADNGMQLTQVTPEFSIAVMTVDEHHLNGAGVCQGGALFTFADLAIAAAMNACGNVTLGLENAMTFHHPARLGDRLTAKAFVTCDHRKIPFCRVEITNADGTLVASGTSLGYRKADAMPFDSLM
ncbi:MAG: PaaI family thioesterase [Bacteroidaceae bacterium]|nr:PaaI family thioesterase [Bacteroidaceae bacterium]